MANGYRGHGRQHQREGGRDARSRASLDTNGIDLRPDENGRLRPELFDKTAQAAARAVAGDKRNQANKPSQLRQFYDELVMWEEKARQERERFAEFLPFIRMLNAKAAYAEGRKNVDGNFVDLIAHCLGQVDSYETLRNFKLFFEAFLGFYKLERPSG
jgi:CRISPR-associated protein Csm2